MYGQVGLVFTGLIVGRKTPLSRSRSMFATAGKVYPCSRRVQSFALENEKKRTIF